MNISIVSTDTQAEVTAVVDFLSKQSLGYPGYNCWVEKTEAELVAGKKTALLAFLNRKLVADIVWQPHRQVGSLLEIKNLRVSPEVRQRDFGRFLLKQAEVIPGFSGIICDVREDQASILQFMQRCGYTKACTLPIYDSEVADVVMIKPLQQNRATVLETAYNVYGA